MALVKCAECGAEISDQAASCPRCGLPMDGRQGMVAAMPPTLAAAPPPPTYSSSYPCPTCGQGFDRGRDLYYHRQTAHLQQKAAPSEQAPRLGQWSYQVNIVCPHCQVTGQVATRQVRIKQGVSGAKATGAVLTGGLSVLATGLSKKEVVTEAHCYNCRVVWAL
jgi:predicted RNA-binding Zn-ribbon protein involved in translation (DUF1610 family)